MTPHAYLRRFRPDAALLTGESFNQGPVQVEEGDVVGVVLLGLGGPSRPDEVVPFLYSRLMDPAEVHLPVPRWARRRVAQALAYRRGRALARAFEMIGGTSPLRRHASEQAVALQRRLTHRYGAATGAEFRTYVAMRHRDPSMAAARAQMAKDGVTKAVLLPLQPHFSATTTGSSLAYWRALDAELGAPTWTESLATEYATQPRFVRALSERIDEGLQRFAREDRERAQILFVAQGVSHRHRVHFGDPYCCHLHATVRAVAKERGEDRPVHLAFQAPIGGGRTAGRSVAEAIDDLADDGASAVLAVPISFISDRVEAAFDLDVTARARAQSSGIADFEVTSGLNCHPLLIEALAECVGAHLQPAARSAPPLFSALPLDGRAPEPCPVCARRLPVRQWAVGPTPLVPSQPDHRSAA